MGILDVSLSIEAPYIKDDDDLQKFKKEELKK